MVVPVVGKLVKRVFVGTRAGSIGTNRCQAVEGAKIFLARSSGLAFSFEVLRVRDIKRSIA